MSLYKRLAEARAEFTAKANFSKVKGDGLKFAYLPVEAAKPLIEECTAKAGVTILPMDFDIIEEHTAKETKTNSYGNATSWLYMTAVVTFKIACEEESEELRIMAEAQDNSDKCINKVYTMAYKNLIKILFGFSESAKDDSKFDDPRQQDNDFNQEPAIIRPRAAPAKKDSFFDKPAKPATQSTLGGGKQ